jgi:hypothetical protein
MIEEQDYFPLSEIAVSEKSSSLFINDTSDLLNDLNAVPAGYEEDDESFSNY